MLSFENKSSLLVEPWKNKWVRFFLFCFLEKIRECISFLVEPVKTRDCNYFLVEPVKTRSVTVCLHSEVKR